MIPWGNSQIRTLLFPTVASLIASSVTNAAKMRTTYHSTSIGKALIEKFLIVSQFVIFIFRPNTVRKRETCRIFQKGLPTKPLFYSIRSFII